MNRLNLNLTLSPPSSKLKSKPQPQLQNLPIDSEGHDNLPISVLINPHSVDASVPLPRDQILFCYQALLNTIDSVLAKRYTDFDGHTTSNCCHGMALLSWHLIQMVLELDLHELRQEYERGVQYLEQHNCAKTPLPCTGHAPKALVNLACLYILYFTKESDPVKGGRTVTKKLKELAPISTKLSTQITHRLQQHLSNWIASQYSLYLDDLDETMVISEASIRSWGKYINTDWIRSDKRGIKHASTLFSMQVFLAYLSQFKGKIALINDIQDDHGNMKERFIFLFEGNGEGAFKPISENQIDHSKEDPIIVLGGCSHSDHPNQDSLLLKLQPWLEKLPQLILACDTFYPQFISIRDDTEFDSNPIIPEEKFIQDLITSHSNISGVSAKDPSLYCLTHICTSSIAQILIKNPNQRLFVPHFTLPKSKQSA